jgi:hypothetical protein
MAVAGQTSVAAKKSSASKKEEREAEGQSERLPKMSIPQTKNLLLLFVCVCVPRGRQKCELKKKNVCVCAA